MATVVAPPGSAIVAAIRRRRKRRALGIGGLCGIAVLSFVIALAARGTSSTGTASGDDAREGSAGRVATNEEIARTDDAQEALADTAAESPSVGAAPEDAAPAAVAPASGARAATTFLEVRTRPDGATVRVAGRRQVAPAQFALPAGRYAIDAEAEGWMPERRSVELVEGVRLIQDIVFTTRLRGTRRAQTGKLTVRTTPPCVVYLGGSRLTETPFTEMEFEPATYTLVFKHPRYATVTKRVTIAAGKTTRLSFKLR
jgi:hypothetical protein